MLRLAPTPIAALFILLSASACAKKENPVPAPTLGTGSYQLDGQPMAGQARAYTGSLNTGSQKTDILYVSISDTPQLQSNTRSVLLTYEKPAGQPNTAYQLTTLAYSKDGTLQGVSYTVKTTTLAETGSGNFSGTFSGAAASGSAIINGIFTDARL